MQTVGKAPLWAAASLLAFSSCAFSPRSLSMPPDAAAVAAAGRARPGFEARYRTLADDELSAGLAAIGRRAIAGAVSSSGSADGWRFVVLDHAEAEAFLFADRHLFLSRGALAELSGEPALEALFRSAAAIYAGGGFRSAGGQALLEQPLRLPMPAKEPPGAGERQAGGQGEGASASRADWLDLLDGLVFGHPPERGMSDGRGLLLPAADLRLSLPGGARFQPLGPGEFVASRAGEPIGLTVRTAPLPEAPDPPMDGDLDRERRFHRELASGLRTLAESSGQESALAEVFRVRGFSGIRARLHEPIADRTASGAPPVRQVPEAAEIRETRETRPAGLIALLGSAGGPVEVRLDCDGRSFDGCEALFLEILHSADRLRDAPLPGPLRLSARPLPRGGSVRRALARLAGSGRSEVTERVLFALNRGWLDEELMAGERVLLVCRDRERGGGGAPPAALPRELDC